MDLHDFEDYKNDAGEHTLFFVQQLQYDLIKSIPKQIEKYFEVQKMELDESEVADHRLQVALQDALTFDSLFEH